MFRVCCELSRCVILLAVLQVNNNKSNDKTEKKNIARGKFGMFGMLRQLAFIVLFGVFCAMVLLGFTCVVSLRCCARFAECVDACRLFYFTCFACLVQWFRLFCVMCLAYLV